MLREMQILFNNFEKARAAFWQELNNLMNELIIDKEKNNGNEN
jgi:hypothetical protein